MDEEEEDLAGPEAGLSEEEVLEREAQANAKGTQSRALYTV